MGTIAQEITRIKNGVDDVWDYCEDNGVSVPAGTTVDQARTYLDQIPHGGEENKFMTLTNLNYVFGGHILNNEDCLDGLKRFSQNDITSLNNTFYESVINTNDQAVVSEIMNYIKTILLKKNIASFKNCFSNTSFQISGYTLDLTNFSPNKRVDISNMFNHFNQGSAATPSGPFMNIKIKSDFFTYANDMQYFKGSGKIDLLIDENKLYFGTPATVQYAFGQISSSRLSFKDYDGNYYKDMYFDFNNQAFLAEGLFASNNGMENIYLENAENVRTYNNAFAQITALKSIHNISFENCNYNTTETPFSTYTNLTNFGDLDIVNGSSLGTYITDLRLHRIWTVSASTLINGQTAGYWFEKFANALGTKTKSGSQTITIKDYLYNTLTTAQKALITDKGYTLTSRN